MIQRQLENIIKSNLGSGKAIVLLGPRQTGKTTLLEKIASIQGEFLLLDCDDPVVKEKLENANTEQLRQLIGTYKIIFIDEAQRIKNIGLTLKIIIDQLKTTQILVSGSSSLDLASEINEPLTGRKWEYMLFPVSWIELTNHFGTLKSDQKLEQSLIFGMYPEVLNNTGNEIKILKELTGSYLYKDLLNYKGIRKPDLLEKIIRSLALQIGNEVSLNELSRQVQVDKNTVSNYLDLLEKAFVIYKLSSLSRNLRNEIIAGRKYYFYDNGIRNALIANFNPLNLRADTGSLWENFLITERLKFLQYEGIAFNCYFWRTTQQQEIDYIEERNGRFYAWEFKWAANAPNKIPSTFLKAYPDVFSNTITPLNFRDFICVI